MDIEKERKLLLSKYIKKEDNLIIADRLFLANSIIEYAIKNKITDNEKLKYFFIQTERHLKEEITLYWEGDKLELKLDDPSDKKIIKKVKKS